MAYQKQEWSSKTPITPESLNHMEKGISDIDNNSVKPQDIKINYIDNQEIETNEYLNDKRIYVKKFNETIPTYKTDDWTDWINVSLLNIDKIVKIYGEMENSDSVTPFPNTENATHYVCVRYFRTNKNLQIIGTGYQNRQVTLFIEYTKN